MLKIVQDDKIQKIVLNVGEEIVITTSNEKTGYVSIYNNGKNMIIDGTINKKTYKIPHQERESIHNKKRKSR